MLIAIPSDAPGGLDAPISEHFGHCAAFTLVHVANGEVGDIKVVANGGHEQGGCMAPVMVLKKLGVDALVAGGMGMRPLSGFQQVGIAVHFKEDASTVRDALELFVAGKCREFGESQTCGGGSGHCGGHHHEEVHRAPIEGKADVRAGRVVTLEFEVKDASGNVLDSSATSGAMRYVHGGGGILGLEKALEGLEAGAHVNVQVPPSEGFGERDDARIISIPRNRIPDDAEVGNILAARDASGNPIPLTVLSLDGDTARLDANHPLAGKTLTFDVTVVRVESATPEELEHGHVH